MTQVTDGIWNFTSVIFEGISSYAVELSNVVLETIGNLALTLNITGLENIYSDSFSTYYFSVVDWFAYDDFQLKLLQAFSLILFVNIALITLCWKVYGKRISEKFMRPPTSKSIEELKKSVSLLKLPKEHSPRV